MFTGMPLSTYAAEVNESSAEAIEATETFAETVPETNTAEKKEAYQIVYNRRCRLKFQRVCLKVTAEV